MSVSGPIDTELLKRSEAHREAVKWRIDSLRTNGGWRRSRERDEFGRARSGLARLGRAWRGMAWRGPARQGRNAQRAD